MNFFRLALKKFIYCGSTRLFSENRKFKSQLYLFFFLFSPPPLGGGTSIDFTEILGTFGFFPENKFFVHLNYENCNIYPKNGDRDPKKQFFGTLEQVFEKSQKVWTVWYLRGVKTRGVLGGLTKITSNSVH